MLALHNGLASLDLTTGQYSMVATPDPDPRNRFNDGKCDPQYCPFPFPLYLTPALLPYHLQLLPRGRFWAGTMEDAETGLTTGGLYVLDASHKAQKKLGGMFSTLISRSIFLITFIDVGVSNGIGWSADQKTMYVTYTNQKIGYFIILSRYYIDSATRRVDSFSFDPATGEISDRKTIVSIPEGIHYSSNNHNSPNSR